MKSSKPDYGIDEPGLARGFLIGAIGLITIGLGLLYLSATLGSWTKFAAVVSLLLGLYPLGMFFIMNWESRVTKIIDREKILNLIKWRGDEQVLDVGCGRGLMMIGAARRLSSGKAIGIDLWLDRDQSSNTEDAPLQNAQIENVSDRVFFETADMRKLPFPDTTFDVVLSSWVVHNLENRDDRVKALAEMMRVLRSGGALLLTDIVNRNEYIDLLKTTDTSETRLIVFSAVKDRILRFVSFGSYGPSTILARKA